MNVIVPSSITHIHRSRQERTNNDLQEISQLIGFLEETIPEQNIRDCMRLYSYKESRKRNRPILVGLNRTCDTLRILGTRNKLVQKQNMSTEERKVEQISVPKMLGNVPHERNHNERHGSVTIISHIPHRSTRYAHGCISSDDRHIIIPQTTPTSNHAPHTKLDDPDPSVT